MINTQRNSKIKSLIHNWFNTHSIITCVKISFTFARRLPHATVCKSMHFFLMQFSAFNFFTRSSQLFWWLCNFAPESRMHWPLGNTVTRAGQLRSWHLYFLPWIDRSVAVYNWCSPIVYKKVEFTRSPVINSHGKISTPDKSIDRNFRSFFHLKSIFKFSSTIESMFGK